MIKNIIFDWSGVIKDHSMGHFIVINKMLEYFGLNKMTLEQLRNEWSEPYMTFWNKYLPDLTKEQQDVVYKKVLMENFNPKEYPGIIDLIQKLKKEGKNIIVISADHAISILPEIKKFGLQNIFNDIEIGIHDKEETLYKIIKRNNFIENETAIIGDSNQEITIGRKAGIKTIAVTWGLCSENNLKLMNPDYIVRNIKELEKIVL
ncbi:MAG TPA: HAD family hydrolase [Candidatus Paceibacterota bacterium]|nr:HAD family hydrolase [Candidatus Paceibacterota bacterium]